MQLYIYIEKAKMKHKIWLKKEMEDQLKVSYSFIVFQERILYDNDLL